MMPFILSSPMLMNNSTLSDFTKEQHLFYLFSSLSEAERESFLHQLRSIDLQKLQIQRELVQQEEKKHVPTSPVFPFSDFSFSGNKEDKKKGQELIDKGSLGCLLLAGGQGTRLQHEGPKGTYPISLIKRKTLFQLFAEKVKAASKKAGHSLQLAIMTSQENDKETRLYFEENNYFGLLPSQITFFMQKNLPFLDKEGHLFLRSRSEIAMGPGGNGDSLFHFAEAGILENWMREGIQFIHIVPIDNPLADPFDPELIGFHARQEGDVTLKCTERKTPDEKVGILVKQEGQCRVIEYFELSDNEKRKTKEDGALVHQCANLSLFCVSLSFIKKIKEENRILPLHKVWKPAMTIDEKGNPLSSHAWKFETFIFDWLLFTTKIQALLFPREECFSPLKNAIGEHSPETVRQDMQIRDKKIIEEITQLPAPSSPFELSQEFYYPSTSLENRWKGKKAPSGYIEAETEN